MRTLKEKMSSGFSTRAISLSVWLQIGNVFERAVVEDEIEVCVWVRQMFSGVAEIELLVFVEARRVFEADLR